MGKGLKNEAGHSDANDVGGGVSDWVKKSLLTKMGAILLTEEGLLDLKLPKTVIKAAVSQADKTKKDLSALVAKEVRMFLDGIELGELIRKVFRGQAIEISATIRFLEAKKEPKEKKKASSLRKTKP